MKTASRLDSRMKAASGPWPMHAVVPNAVRAAAMTAPRKRSTASQLILILAIVAVRA